jgi:cell division protein FtsB
VKLKRAGIGTKILVLVLLVAAITALLSLRSQLQTAQARRDELDRQVQEQQEVNAALADDIAHSDDPEYLANIARSKLGLLEPDEICFVDTSN